jgi:hypothetical protein
MTSVASRASSAAGVRRVDRALAEASNLLAGLTSLVRPHAIWRLAVGGMFLRCGVGRTRRPAACWLASAAWCARIPSGGWRARCVTLQGRKSQQPTGGASQPGAHPQPPALGGAVCCLASAVLCCTEAGSLQAGFSGLSAPAVAAAHGRLVQLAAGWAWRRHRPAFLLLRPGSSACRVPCGTACTASSGMMMLSAHASTSSLSCLSLQRNLLTHAARR